MNDLSERLELSALRLREIMEESESLFFRDAAGLSLGFAGNDGWLDFSVCRQFSDAGVYLCLLYAQIWQLYAEGLCDEKAAADAGEEELELLAASRELLLLIRGQMEDGEGAAAVRDSLYWFYMDYAELTIGHAVRLSGKGASFGGAMLAWPGESARTHKWDCGLYLGSRYAGHLLEGLKKAGAGAKPLVSLILAADPTEEVEGAYALTGHQKEVFLKLQEELRNNGRKE